MTNDGKPDLLSGPAPVTDLRLATADTDVRLRPAPVAWGIYLNGEKIIEPDSFLALEYHREWAVADYPMERGAFSTYDKVAKPFDVRLRLAKGGNDNVRTTFLAAIENLGTSLTLYDVVTPTRTYLGVTISSIGYQQTAKTGVGLITVEIGLREIRETASSAMSAEVVHDPGSASPKHGGTVQPQPVTPAAEAAVRAALARQASPEQIARKALAPAGAAGAPSR